MAIKINSLVSSGMGLWRGNTFGGVDGYVHYHDCG